MVMSGRSVHITTLFSWASLNKPLTSIGITRLAQSYVVGQVMALYSPDWIKTGFAFIFLTVNLFRHPTLIEQGLYYVHILSLVTDNNPS